MIVKNAFLVFLGFLNYHHANANNHFKLSLYFIVFCCGYLEHVRVWGIVSGYLKKEITNHETTISNHSFNGSHNATILKF
ncbi:hypothetical protein HPB14_01975 [Helicobacter pylori HUP-B14]|nr:hypothetical protein HPB14_01975 [Helicobacter pylori HUP-B14]